MINVLYAGNIAVFDGLLISLLSLAKHTKEPFTAYVLTMDLHQIDAKYIPITDEQIALIQSEIEKYNVQNKIIKLDITQIYLSVFDGSKNNEISRCTPYAMLRLLASMLDLPSKIIYLDVDTIINNDIGELYNIDISNYEVGAVRDIMFVNFVGFFNYFNSGVMLLNLDKIRQTKSFEKAIELCIHKRMAFADQDALNKSIKHRLMIPYKFNWFRQKCKYYPEIVVHHMCNARQPGNQKHRIKPWGDDLKYFVQQFPMYTDLLDECHKIKEQLGNDKDE